MCRNTNFGGTPNGGTVNPDNVGNFLLFAAGHSEAIKNALVRALVAPGVWAPVIPKLSDHDLATAIRACSWMSGNYALSSPEDVIWRAQRELLQVVLRSQTRPPLLPRDIKRVRETIRTVAEYYQANSDALKGEISKFEVEYDVLGKCERDLMRDGAPAQIRTERLKELRLVLRGKNGRKPHRGGRFSEHDLRKLAAFMFLVDLGASKTKAQNQVGSALYDWGIEKSAAEGIRSLETRYRKAHGKSGRMDAFHAPGNLPILWLEQLGGLFLWWRKRANPPEFISVLLTKNLQPDWETARQSFLGLVGGQSDGAPSLRSS
jgi:hypothetical protein